VFDSATGRLPRCPAEPCLQISWGAESTPCRCSRRMGGLRVVAGGEASRPVVGVGTALENRRGLSLGVVAAALGRLYRAEVGAVRAGESTQGVLVKFHAVSFERVVRSGPKRSMNFRGGSPAGDRRDSTQPPITASGSGHRGHERLATLSGVNRRHRHRLGDAEKRRGARGAVTSVRRGDGAAMRRVAHQSVDNYEEAQR